MKRFYFFILLVICVLNSNAQVIEFPYTEEFENAEFPPAGWIGYPIVAGDMEFVRVTEGEWPECLPHDGSIAMAQYNSFNASIGEEAVLISPELLLTEDNILRFWFFRSEDPSNNRLDKIEVYYNSTPELIGATLLDSIHRAINFYPEVSIEDWYQYEFEFSNPGSTYIIFKAISAYGWKMYLDDVEVNINFVDVDPPEVISLDGTQAYAQQEMKLSLRARDDSDMPATLDGEVIISGQTNDVLFTKISGQRADFIYETTIAGQPDHTEAELRIWLIDELQNAAWSDFYTLNWDWVQPILEEGFEGETFPPEGWTVTGQPLTWLTWDDYGMVNYIDSDGVEWEVYPPQGERQAAVEWDFQGNVQNEWLISPPVSIDENATLTFKTFARLYSYDYDEYLVHVSTDGFNWETLWSAADYPAGVSNYNEDISLSLDNYLGSEIRVAWQAYNLLGSNLWYSWFIDDVKIRASDTIVGIEKLHETRLCRAFPNPFTTNFQMNFYLDKTCKVSLIAFRNDGCEMYSKTFGTLDAGKHCFTIDGTNWPAGFYYYQLKTGTGITSGKLIRQ
jgi:hypothetical protein